MENNDSNHAFIIREVQLLRIATENIGEVCMVFNNDNIVR